MSKLTKRVYGKINSIEFHESMHYPGEGCCLVTVNVVDSASGRTSTITVYDRSGCGIERCCKPGDRVSLECVVEYPRPGLRRYFYYGGKLRRS